MSTVNWMAACGVLLLTAAQAQAALTFYTSRSVFEAANQTLIVEDFSEAVVSSYGLTSTVSPLSSLTDRPTVFPSGLDQPGVVISASPDGEPLAVISPDFRNGFFTRDYWVGSDYGESTLNLSFADGGVLAVAADVADWFDSTFYVSVFGSGDALLGSTTVALAHEGPALYMHRGFFGVSSNDPSKTITRINLYSRDHLTGGYSHDFVTNLAFSPPLPPSPSIPEPFSLAIWGGLGAVGVAVAVAHRRRAKLPSAA